LIEVLLKTPVFEFAKDWSGADNAEQTGTLNGGVPGGIQVDADIAETFQDTSAAAASALMVSSFDQTNTAVSEAIASFLADIKLVSNGGGNSSGTIRRLVRTSTSRTIRYRASGTTADHDAAICLNGWRDSRL
jgi:hypothetical protein